jgi:hypothetical protein
VVTFSYEASVLATDRQLGLVYGCIQYSYPGSLLRLRNGRTGNDGLRQPADCAGADLWAATGSGERKPRQGTVTMQLPSHSSTLRSAEMCA